ncbi:ATPase, T2SS/T4P/T4SS family [Nocardioides sp.]|uniref:ATPase, T2SS/T4P/T4SS family n=1 Tax=Nocardioides sp. TaxID=35761 RepID=UPI00260FE2D4|nr:ATPase, T2SS/T4P/T4SS family [Nocardioides sp.]
MSLADRIAAARTGEAAAPAPTVATPSSAPVAAVAPGTATSGTPGTPGTLEHGAPAVPTSHTTHAAHAAAAGVETPLGPDEVTGKRRADVTPPPYAATVSTPASAPSTLGQVPGTTATAGPGASPAPADAALRRTLGGQQSERLEAIKASVHEQLLRQLGPQLYDADLDARELDQKVRAVLQEVLATQERPLSNADRQRVTQEISDDILGLGPIEPYLRDPEVSEVMVNGANDIWLERHGRLIHAEGRFADEAHLRRTIDKIVSRIGRRVDESSPMVDARLPDGSRVNAVVPPLAMDGSALTIRKFSADALTAEDLERYGSFSPAGRRLLEACVRGRLNVIVSGGTGAGKTTTLNVLSSFIPADERIVTIDDAAELQLKQEHVVRLEARPANIEGRGAITIRDLVRNALRMRPDRIIVGEVRDASALDMLQAMNTGHDGSICTLHSNGPRDTLARLETMVLMAGMDLPVRAIREQVASAVDLIVHQTRLKDGTRRITHITEVERMEGDVITLQDIFVFDNTAGFDADGRALGRLRPTGLRPKFLDKLAESNVVVDPLLFLDR